MEETLTIEELNLLAKEAREKEQRANEFLAAIQGIDITPKDDRFEQVKRRAEADLAGKTPEQLFFDEVGIDIETDEEDVN